MPSTITHAYFIEDVYNKLNPNIKNLLVNRKDNLKIASQGMDVLFFYNIVSFKPGKNIRDFGHLFHESKTKDFFITLIKYIKSNNYINNEEVLSFLYGLLSHYILDSNMHPFIIYKSGVFNKKDKSSYKYNHLHGEVETFIDNYFVLTRENIMPYKFKSYNFCLNYKPLSIELKQVIDYTFKKVFNIKDMGSIYYKSVQDMRRFYIVFRNDPSGIKKTFYKLVDKVCPKSLLRKEVLSYHFYPQDKWNILNEAKDVWYNPVDKNIKSNKSLLEIYNLALEQTISTINDIDSFLHTSKNIDLDKLFPNTSYVTGLNCDIANEKELKYFEF